MKSLAELMAELDGADADKVKWIAWREGALPVRMAMLALAANRKEEGPLWWGYPPGVFIGYQWSSKAMHDIVSTLADHIRGLGYRAFLDVENLDEDADAYFQIPRFITSLQDCSFYVLLLTASSGDVLTARTGQTTWAFDEFQHAVRLLKSGRLYMVPVLLEPNGMTEQFASEHVLDLTATPHDFSKLDDVLSPAPIALREDEMKDLSSVIARFDRLFVNQQWDASDSVLQSSAHLGHTFDHQFRRLLHSIYTADQTGVEVAFGRLLAVYGKPLLDHIYAGYCARHRIPNRKMGR